MMVKFSIIIPVYNAESYVAETLESALMQTCSDLEIVCVDDASTDSSIDILSSYSKKYSNVRVVRNLENLGLATTRNVAIENASGEFILPLDADDLIDPTYCEKALQVFSEDPSVAVVYCEANMFDSKSMWYWELPEYSRLLMFKANHVFCSGLFKKADWEMYGGYRANMKHGYEDWDFWLHFVLEDRSFFRIPEVLFYYRQSDGSMIQRLQGRTELMIKQIHSNFPELKVQELVGKLQASWSEEDQDTESTSANFEKSKRYEKVLNHLLNIPNAEQEKGVDEVSSNFANFLGEFTSTLEKVDAKVEEQQNLEHILHEREREIQMLTAKLHERNLTIESAVSWQSSSWFNRTFHKWRP